MENLKLYWKWEISLLLSCPSAKVSYQNEINWLKPRILKNVKVGRATRWRIRADPGFLKQISRKERKKIYGRSKIFWHLLCHLQVCLSAFWVISSFLRLKTVLNRTLGQTSRNFNPFGLQFINCQSLGIILQPIIKLGYLLIVPTSCRHLDNKDKFRDIYNIYRNMIIPLINQPIDNRLTTNTQIEQEIGLVW